ncbi:MAG: flagellar biosynthetic protein FliO [Caloramator sp.]|nr:flagellar biosynthetic protein FliO [Caloramator sp.]
MNTETLFSVIKLIVFLPMIIFFIILSAKYGGKYLNKLGSGRLIKVYERVPLSQNSFLSVVTIAGKPYIISNTQNEIKILLELNQDDLEVYKNNLENIDFNIFKRKMHDEKIQ